MRFLVLLISACAIPDPPAPEPPVRVPVSEPPPTEPVAAPEPTWDAQIRKLTEPEKQAMLGVSWREGCPVHIDALSLIDMPHHTPDGMTARGELIVHDDAAQDVERAFESLWRQGFAITRMRPVRHYGGDDDRSMAADNTSGFNCRPVSGTKGWSQHAYGRAIDVNPLRNPYVRGERVDPPQGAEWLERDPARPGVLVSGTPQVAAFQDVGWKWGGHWRSAKDYQHFSRSGR